MRPRPVAPSALLVLSLLTPVAATAASPSGPTKMLAQPALSAERVAFVYGNHLWTSRLDGSGVQRITSGPGTKTSPAFRPREAFNNRHDQLYTVPVEGGVETKLPIPHADRAVFSPDGKTIAYPPNRPRHLQWKRYRGGTVSRLWLYDVATHAVVKVPQPEGRCNDLNPAWVGGTPYLTFDRDGEFNVYAFDPKAMSLAKVKGHDDFPVLATSAANGKIVYEQAGLLHLLDPAPETIRKWGQVLILYSSRRPTPFGSRPPARSRPGSPPPTGPAGQ